MVYHSCRLELPGAALQFLLSARGGDADGVYCLQLPKISFELPFGRGKKWNIQIPRVWSSVSSPFLDEGFESKELLLFLVQQYKLCYCHQRTGLFSVITQVPSIISLTKASWGKMEVVLGFNSCMESMALNHYVVFSGPSFCVLDLLQPRRQLSAGEDWDLGIRRWVWSFHIFYQALPRTTALSYKCSVIVVERLCT